MLVAGRFSLASALRPLSTSSLAGSPGSMSKKHCLDNPSLPSKLFRDNLTKRRKLDQAAIKEKLTPALVTSWQKYCENGKTIGADTYPKIKGELGAALNDALDGQPDVNCSCRVCQHMKEEAKRMAECEAAEKVCSFLPPSAYSA